MYKDINELIDINLSLIANEQKQSIFITNFRNKEGKSPFRSGAELLRFAENMAEKGLITIEATQRQRCDLTEFGHKIFTNGGWLNYLAIQNELQKNAEKEKEKNLDITNIVNKKLENEYKLSKWQKITFWPVFVLGLFASFYSVYDWSTKDNYVSKEQMKLEILKLQQQISKSIKKKTILLQK